MFIVIRYLLYVVQQKVFIHILVVRIYLLSCNKIKKLFVFLKFIILFLNEIKTFNYYHNPIKILCDHEKK